MRLPTIKIEKRHRRHGVRLRWKRKDIRWSEDSEARAHELKAEIEYAIRKGRFDGTRESLGEEHAAKVAKTWTLNELMNEFERVNG